MKTPPLWISVLAAFLAITGIAVAQDADPPSRVARIAYIAGSVSFEPASVDGWADASLNYPMTTGDNLYTDNDARSVLRIGRNSIRLNSNTNFQFVNLNDSVVQTSINSGSLSLHLRHLFDSESWEVDTPNGAVTLLRTGDYRVDTDTSRNATMVTVRSGDTEVTANDQSFPVHSGQTAYFDNSGNAPDVQNANEPDDFDAFASSRDQLEDAPPPRYVSPDMDGYEDLNNNGDWRDTPEYGPVWTPRVEAGWTPYHQGHWAWVDPWGWTWVDDEPWGFAPFHYGRWAYLNNRWGWCPGVVSERPYYAPALVAFVGGGGLVGWFPLGPREAYYPSYHVSQGYVRQVNVTNARITNLNVTSIQVTNVTYVNRNAMVAMPQNSFASAQSVQRAGVHVNASQLRQAQVVGAAPRVAPQRESVLASTSSRRAVAPPAAIANRPVVAKLAPPPAAVPFAARQQMLQQHPGTPVAPAQLRTLRAQVAQHPAPARMQVQAINTRQVRAVTPTVHAGRAPTFAQRPAQAPPGAPKPAVGSPHPPAAVHTQAPPPVRQPPPPVRTQAEPPVRQPPPPVHPQASPPVRQPLPPVHTQAEPPVRQPPPPVQRQSGPPVRPQNEIQQHVQPPVRQEPPVRQQVQPPVRQAPRAPEEARPPSHPAPPVVREERQAPAVRPPAQPARQPPPPQKAPPKKQEQKPEGKKE